MATNTLVAGGIDRIYKLAFRKHFTNHECNFPPNRSIELGDYGVMRNGYYERIGNVKDLGVTYTEKKDNDTSHETFKSSSDISTTFRAKGDLDAKGIKLANATMEVSFKSSNAVYFSSAEMEYNQIENLADLGEQILALYKAGKWKKDHFIITRVIGGKNTVVIISGSSECKVEIKADISAPLVDLSKGSIGLSIGNTTDDAFSDIIPGFCELGMGFSRVYDNFFIAPTFKVSKTNSALFAGLDNKPYNVSKSVVFGDTVSGDYDFTV